MVRVGGAEPPRYERPASTPTSSWPISWRCRHSVCADTAGAPVCGSSSHVQIIWISESFVSSKVPIASRLHFFLEKRTKKPKDSAKHVRPAVGCTNSSESSSRTAIQKGYPNLADRLHTDTPVTIPDATNAENSQFLPAHESIFFLETAALVTQE